MPHWTKCAVCHALGKVWRGHRGARALPLCLSHASTVLSKHDMGIELLFCAGFLQVYNKQTFGRGLRLEPRFGIWYLLI